MFESHPPIYFSLLKYERFLFVQLLAFISWTFRKRVNSKCLLITGHRQTFYFRYHYSASRLQKFLIFKITVKNKSMFCVLSPSVILSSCYLVHVKVSSKWIVVFQLIMLIVFILFVILSRFLLCPVYFLCCYFL